MGSEESEGSIEAKYKKRPLNCVRKSTALSTMPGTQSLSSVKKMRRGNCCVTDGGLRA